MENTPIFNSNVESSELRTYCKMEGLCYTKLVAEEEDKKKKGALKSVFKRIFSIRKINKKNENKGFVDIEEI